MNQGGSSASNISPAPQSQEHRLAPRLTLAVCTSIPLPPLPGHAGQNEALSRAAADYPLDTFEVVTSLHRPVRAPFDGVIISSQDNFDPWYPPGCYSSNPRLDSYITYLFTIPHKAITDSTMDFYAILAEIRGIPSTPPPASPAAEERRGEDYDAPQQVSGQSTTAHVNRASTHMAITADDNQRFLDPGTPRRPTHSEASSSGIYTRDSNS